MTGSLLEAVQGLLTRTFRLTAPLEAIGRYVIGDAGLRLLYADRPQEVYSAAGEGAKLLVREDGSAVRACIYYPDAMIAALEAYPPQRGLGDRNVQAFAALVEELDHLLTAADRAHRERSISLLELELHANVSKYLVLARFSAGRGGRLDPGRRLWLRQRLFGAAEFSSADPGVRRRYRDAVRFAVRFLDRLEVERPAARLDALRRFHRAPLQEMGTATIHHP